MTRIRELITACLVAISMSIALVPVLEWLGDFGCEGTAIAYPGDEQEMSVASAIRTLQPMTSDERASQLAGVFVGAGHETRIDPLLLVAIAMRESSLREDVERLERLGRRGERGLLQLMPRGAAVSHRPTECSAELEGAHCQVYTGAMWLAHLRDEQCPGSTWRWVAAYGWSRCPSEREARADRNAAVAASYYSRIGGSEWR